MATYKISSSGVVTDNDLIGRYVQTPGAGTGDVRYADLVSTHDDVEIWMSTWSNGDQKFACLADEPDTTYWNAFGNPFRSWPVNDLWSEARAMLTTTWTGGGSGGHCAPQWASDFQATARGRIPREMWEAMTQTCIIKRED